MVEVFTVPQMKTSRLVKLIVDQIESGKLSAGDRLPAERDLAKRYNCSRSTVRSSLEQLEKMSYIQRQQGRGTFISEKKLKTSNPLKTIGIILITSKDNLGNDPYVSQVTNALRNTSSRCPVNYNLLTLSYEERLESHLAKKGLSINSFDGYLALGYNFSNTELELLQKYNIPATSCSNSKGNRTISSVQIDNKSGAYIATNHLLTLGRRRLLLLNDKSNSEFAIAKREGFRQALSEYGITYNDSMECGILPYEDTLAYKTIKKILNECQDKRPDALLVYGDWATYGAVTAIREAGLKIPEDIALVMYDDYPWVSKVLGLAVSAVRQPLEEQASHALTLLLERMEDSEETVNTIEILQPQLIVRRSCGSDLFH